MSDKENAQNVIEAYRKRQQAARKAPLLFGIMALLLIVGAAFLIFWLLGSGGANSDHFPLRHGYPDCNQYGYPNGHLHSQPHADQYTPRNRDPDDND